MGVLDTSTRTMHEAKLQKVRALTRLKKKINVLMFKHGVLGTEMCEMLDMADAQWSRFMSIPHVGLMPERIIHLELWIAKMKLTATKDKVAFKKLR